MKNRQLIYGKGIEISNIKVTYKKHLIETYFY